MSDFIWVEKYRPKKIEECILPQGIKDTFLQFLKKGEIPNLLLSGPAGCGKTTVAKSLMKQTIPLPMYSSFSERLLRSSPKTADSYSLATTKIKSLNPCIRDVLWLSLVLRASINKR